MLTKDNMTMMAQYRDEVTGFVGVLVGHGQFLNGGYQALLQPKVQPDGTLPDAQYFSVDRLTFSG